MRQTPPSQENRRWVVHRYYSVDQGRGWDLCDGRNRLPRHNETRVSRFVKVTGKASPFDPSLRDYWEDSRTRRLVREASHFHRVHLLQRQEAGARPPERSPIRTSSRAAHQRRGARQRATGDTVRVLGRVQFYEAVSRAA
jgi:hypothetical protein